MTGLLSTERRNFIRSVFYRPVRLFTFLPTAVVFLISYAGRKITVKGTKRAVAAPSVRAATCKFFLDRLPEITFEPYSGSDVPSIKLAGRTIEAVPHISWKHTYEDIEDTFALNRFGWLLAALVECPSPKVARNALHWIEDWIKKMSDDKTHPAWESYSVSERLSNWPFILRIIERLIPLPYQFMVMLEEAVLSHLDYLIAHLELKGRFTNNHILNNARGLYIGGMVMGHDKAVSKAKELFYEWTEKIFHSDGMTREGSSHYQCLLSQRYEQVGLIACKDHDKLFHAFIIKWVNLTKRATDFLSVPDRKGNRQIPLIGDISPDFTPSWLIQTGKGWSKLKIWLKQEQNTDIKNTGLVQRNGGFVRFDMDRITIFWHIENGEVLPFRHGHYDIGGFSLFYDGQEVFADQGRYTYTAEGSYGRYARAHSSIIIDSLGPLCEDNRLNALGAYNYTSSQYNVYETGGRLYLEIETNGFERLLTPVKWCRRFIVENNCMRIVDVMKSAESNSIETRFQIASDCKVAQHGGEIAIAVNSDKVLKLKADQAVPWECKLIEGGHNSTEESFFSREYGTRISGTTVLFQRQLHYAQKHTYEITWQ